jgi:leader peptidase (prepilin peptidase)/N-methyltransferase
MDQMFSQILISLAAAAIGAAAGIGATALSRILMRRRGLDDQLPKKIHIALPIVMALLFTAGYLFFGLTIKLGYLMCIAMLALMISLIDIKHRVIPNELILSMFILTAGFVLIGKMEFDWLSSLWGMLICLVVFLLPALFKNSIGMGDVKLAAAIGFSAGLMGSLYTIVLMGVLIIITSLLRYHPTVGFLKTLVPMGPFIMMAFMVIEVVF